MNCPANGLTVLPDVVAVGGLQLQQWVTGCSSQDMGEKIAEHPYYAVNQHA